ncbi:(2Fe-2S) ferredoxin domain-containing protein, partial [Streptomyces sp. NPDC053705]
MSRRPRKAAGTGPSRPTVSVCRGCCCGTPKIPGVDHAGQLAQLRGALDGAATVRAVECLDA